METALYARYPQTYGISMLAKLRSLYKDDTVRAHRFRYGLLAFDLITIGFVIVTSFFPHTRLVEAADMILGAVILADFLARLAISKRKSRMLLNPVTWADIASIVSFLAPIAGEAVGFLRILRTLRLLHTYQLLVRMRQDFSYFRQHEDIILASINLLVFLFVTTGLIYALQHGVNPEIQSCSSRQD